MNIRFLLGTRSLFLNRIFTRIEYIDKLKKNMKINSSILSELTCVKDKLYNMLLNEADLGKIPLGNLYFLGMDNGKNLLSSLDGMIVLVSSHTYSDGSNRYIKDSNIREYILPPSYNGYRNHIKFILEEVNLKFKEKTSTELTDFLINKFQKAYPNLMTIKRYDDDLDDLHCKFSIYKLFNYNGRLFMLEGALGVNISILSYDFKPLIQIKNEYDEIFEKFINEVGSVYRSKLNSDAKKNKGISKRYNSSNDEKISIFNTINNLNLEKPIISVTGYSSIFKEVEKDSLRFIPRLDFNQNQYSNDLYVSKVVDKDLLLCFPIDEGEITNLETSEFEAMKRFEKARPKHGS